MKKIISILLTIGMLATLFVMPVSAAETTLFTAYPNALTLGEGTTLNAEGDKVVFDEKGDSVSYTFDLETAGIYKIGAAIKDLGQIATAPYRDSFVMNLYIDGDLVSTSAGVASTYTEGRKPFDILRLEAGRHTIKVENALGAYNVSSLHIYADDYCVEENVSKKFKTYSEINSTASFNRGGVDGSLDIAALMAQSKGDTISGVVGVPEDGVYDFTANVCGYYGVIGCTTNTFNVTLNGETVAVPNFDFAKDYEWKEVTLMDNVSLTKGVYPFTIACSGSGNVQTFWDELMLTKVEGDPTFTYQTINIATSASNMTHSGCYHPFGAWVATQGARTYIDWKFTVTQAGWYTSKMTWQGYDETTGKTIYPRAYIDGICYYNGTIADETGLFGYLKETQNVSTLGDVYLTAGEHTVRVYSGGGSWYVPSLAFVGKAPVTNATVEVPAVGFDASTSIALEEIFGGGEAGKSVYFTDGAYANYKVYAPANGFYNVGVAINKGAGVMSYVVSANGTEGKGTITGVEGSDWRTENLTGSIYLNAGLNDVLVCSTGTTNTITYKFVLTPVAYADRVVNVKAAALYDASENVATAITANTEYTAVADIAGAYIGKPVTLMVGVYAGGKLVEAHSVTGTTVFGQTIEKTFTTPEAAGDYTVKVFMFDGLGTLKPYTTDATVVAPAAAEAE